MTFTSRPSILALVGAIALTGLQTAAFAGEPMVPNGRSITVETADLNLGSPEGQARLDRRIGVAARRVCQRAGARSLSDLTKTRACEEAALASAQPQRDELVAAAEARDGRTASRVVLSPGVN